MKHELNMVQPYHSSTSCFGVKIISKIMEICKQILQTHSRKNSDKTQKKRKTCNKVMTKKYLKNFSIKKREKVKFFYVEREDNANEKSFRQIRVSAKQ